MHQQNTITEFASLENVATEFRNSRKKVRLIFAHNGTGKTRLSMAFKELGKSEGSSDTLYFNAFTEDLFHWDNDLEHDENRTIKLNRDSKFFDGLDELEMEHRIRPFLNRYADFNFILDYENWEVSFFKDIIVIDENGEDKNETIENIKVSRGEENIFIWCFFLAIVEIALDEEINVYNWVKYIYMDDPISSLDDNNVIIVASHLAKLLRDSNGKEFIISTHHGLFYNVIFNELNGAAKYLLRKNTTDNNYTLETLTKDTPFYQHIGILKDLKEIAQSGKIYTYHFNLLRNILEKTAAFHGYDKFSDCIKVEDGDTEKIIHARRINILSHGNYSIFEPQEMQEENKEHFKKVLENFIEEYQFNNELFPVEEGQS